MDKIRKFVVLPLLALSCAVFLTFSTILIVLFAKPYSKGTYSYSMNMFIVSIDMDLSLEKDGKGKTTTVTSSFLNEEGPITEVADFEYYVKKGSLYIKNDEYPEFTEMGKINAFEIYMEDPEATEDEAMTITLKNDSAIKLRKTSVTLMIVFGIVALLCVAYIVVEKVLIKKKSQSSVIIEETSKEPQQETNGETPEIKE